MCAADGNIVLIRSGDGTVQYSGSVSVASPLFAEEVNLLNPSDGIYGTISQRVAILPDVGGNVCSLDK